VCLAVSGEFFPHPADKAAAAGTRMKIIADIDACSSGIWRFVSGNRMMMNVPPSAACPPYRNGITWRVALGSASRSMGRSFRWTRTSQPALKGRRDGCRGHGYGDDQFVNDLGDSRRERRFSGDAIDPPLRLAASVWIWRDPLQQTTRLDQRKDHRDLRGYRPLACRCRSDLMQDRLSRRRVEDRMTGRPQERRPVPAQHAGVDKTVDDTIPASADVMTQTPDDMPHVPALQMLPHGIVDISKQCVAGPGISGPYCPVFRDRQPAVNGQVGQERAGQADLDEGAAPDGNVPLVIQRGEQQHLCDQHN